MFENVINDRGWPVRVKVRHESFTLMYFHLATCAKMISNLPKDISQIPIYKDCKLFTRRQLLHIHLASIRLVCPIIAHFFLAWVSGSASRYTFERCNLLRSLYRPTFRLSPPQWVVQDEASELQYKRCYVRCLQCPSMSKQAFIQR